MNQLTGLHCTAGHVSCESTYRYALHCWWRAHESTQSAVEPYHLELTFD